MNDLVPDNDIPAPDVVPEHDMPVVQAQPRQEEIRTAPPKSMWEKAKAMFGDSWETEKAKAANALVYSDMFGISPSQAYKYHDEISSQVKDRLSTENVSTETHGYGGAIKAGAKSSIVGIMSTQSAPKPFDSVSQMERWLYGFSEMAGDLPTFLGGYLVGGGTPVSGTAGGMGLTAGMRQVLIDHYTKGTVKDFGDFARRTFDAVKETMKGETVGATMGIAGKIPVGLKAVNELSAMTVAGKLVEGQVPSKRDFIDNAAMFAAMHIGLLGYDAAAERISSIHSILEKNYVDKGDHPSTFAPGEKDEPDTVDIPKAQSSVLLPAVKRGDEITIGKEGQKHDDLQPGETTQEAEVTQKDIDIEGIGPIRIIRDGDKLTANLVDKNSDLAGQIGDAIFSAGKLGEYSPTGVEVGEKYRRKGVATALYDAAKEMYPKIDLSKVDARTADGEAFRKSYDAKGEKEERGFVASDDTKAKFMTREESAGWLEKNDPDVYERWKAIGTDELHSQDYNEARKAVTVKRTKAVSEGLGEAGKIDLEPAIVAARAALDKMREGAASRKYGEALRTFFTGNRDVRVAETNQLRDALAKIIPDYQDQEALSLLRDFKNRPGGLEAKRQEYELSGDEDLQKIIPIIDRALNPSDALREADRQMDEYFKGRLEEGKKLGFLDSHLTSEEYITHLLEPEDQAQNRRWGFSRGKIGRKFQFGRERKYETILDALENPYIKVKTFNALDALTIYGDKHATAAATKLLTTELKKTEMGKWGFRTAKNIPRDWVEISPGSELFRNRLPYIDENGEAHVATQNLYVPQIVADALAPIVDPATISNIPGFKAGRIYQAYIKSVELGLSVFHMKAMNITGMNNESLNGLFKSYKQDMESDDFKAAEKKFIKAGLTTSILGRTIEAYKAATPKTFPSRMDILRGKPGIKQLDQFAQYLTHETFDVMQRKFKVTDASLKEAAWIAKHPNATAAELFKAQREIAKEVNAAYGGLQWENLGVNRNTLELSKALMLAPDWTFSNVFNAKYAFEGGAAGPAARKFWIKSAVTGIIATQALSTLINGKPSDHMTEVYLGKDNQGKDMYSNMFFAGAPKDFITLVNNVADYGAVEGIAHSIAAKLGPVARTGMEVMTNKDWMGRDIVKKTDSFGKKTGAGAWELTKNLAPIPFSVSSIVQLLTDNKTDHVMEEYMSALAGTPVRHVAPYAGQKTGRRRFSIRGY